METFLNPANPFWSWLLRTAAQASQLICIVLLVQWLFGRRLSPRWRFALWWLVLVRLMMPVSMESALSIFNLVTFSATSRPPPVAVALAPRQDSPPGTPAPGGQEPSRLYIDPVNPPPLLDPATPRLDQAALLVNPNKLSSFAFSDITGNKQQLNRPVWLAALGSPPHLRFHAQARSLAQAVLDWVV